ncbi:CocE/NonD family hydrolase [Microbacterium sp. KR10-403]|uniref:CocE/NonD family hydrolase n=1 Tax=Microbacterium sp. KR10-403 TaxID=3158581 RepID=UPI0032E4777C
MTTLKQRITRAIDARSRKGVTLGPHDIEIIRDLRTPMDDGVELLGDLYRPVGADGTLPTILIRGPYGRSGMMGGAARTLAYEGFTVFFQSCRGTAGSEGVFTPQIDEQRDGIATHRWVHRQEWFTGKLATYGQSYMGYTQWAVAAKLLREDPDNAPDALVLHITMPDFGAITWDNNAFALRNALGWTRMMVRMRKGGLMMLGMLLPDRRLEKAFDVLPLSGGDLAASGESVHWYQDWVRHERLTDEYWTQQNHEPSVPDVTAPVFMLSGWYDIFLPWQLRNYRRLVEAGNAPRLTLGPWGHITPTMAAPAHNDTVGFLREVFAGQEWARPEPVRAFQTGAEQWHDLPVWPPAGAAAQSWFLHAGGIASTGTPSVGTTPYTYDPQHPTPALGGPSLLPKTAPVDNAAHEKRDDVVVFRSETLADPLEIAGEPVARIRLRSSAPSVDVFVRITDVSPDGRSMTVCDGIRRVGSVGSGDAGAPDADGVREIDVPLWPAFHRFAAGHQVGIQISSGAHPRYARNPGTGEAAFTATETVVAHNEIVHGPDGSRVDLPVWVR